MNRMLCHLCFWFTMNALMCEAWKTGECMDKKGVMVEEWKARRKEWKKKRWKKREKGKSGFGKSPFCFCLTVCFASSLFFPAPTTPPHHHATTHAHTHPPPTIHHDTLAHTIKCKQGCVLCCLFLGVDSKTHTASSTPLTPSLDVTQHTRTNQTQTQLMAQATKKWHLSMRRGLDKGQKWDNTTAPTHWLKWQQTQWLWNTLDCGWPLRDGLAWLTLTMTKCLTPSHHTHIHPIQPSNPHPFIPLHSQTQPPCLLPIPQHSSPLSFCTVLHDTLPQPHIIWLLKKKERRGFLVRGRKGVAHLSGFFEVTQNHSTLLNNHPHREAKRKKGNDCYGHTKRKAPLLVWSVKLSLFGPG